MATKLEHLDLEKAHFEHFKYHIPGYKSMNKDTVQQLLDLGLLQVSTAFETALANCGGHTVVSEDQADISDGSEAKLSSVRTSGHGKSYSANVSNTKNKTGMLRVQVYERKLKQFYYFLIPNSAYRQVGRTSNIEIPFLLDGTPKRYYSPVRLPNWWKFEVSSFAELSR
jgi:hypothetical protein